MTRENEIRARLDAATPGPWESGNRYSVCGVMPKMFGEGKCSACSGDNELIWEGRRDINGRVMPSHVHRTDKPWSETSIYHYEDGEVLAVVIETDEYGLMSDEDKSLITNAPTDIAYLLDENARLRAIVKTVCAYKEQLAVSDSPQIFEVYRDLCELDLREQVEPSAPDDGVTLNPFHILFGDVLNQAKKLTTKGE